MMDSSLSSSFSSSSKKRHRPPDDVDAGGDVGNIAPPLQDVPTTDHYQVSLMHRRTVTHCSTSPRHGFVITGSADGVVKFWKRTSTSNAPIVGNPGGGASGIAIATDKASSVVGPSRCLEFVKSYSSHVGPLLGLVTSQPNGDSAVSVGYDGSIKFYDVATFDVGGMIRTDDNSSAGRGGGGGGSGGENMRGWGRRFRLGRHAALIEREDLFLLISTRAPTREEWQDDVRKQKERSERRRQQAAVVPSRDQGRSSNNNEDDGSDDDDDDGPLPQPSNEAKNDDRASISGNIDDGFEMVPPGSILLFSGTSLSSEPLRVFTHHAAPVTAMAYHPSRKWIVSGDASGVLEVWNPTLTPSSSSSSSTGSEDGGSSNDGHGGLLPFGSKFDTDLYALMRKKSYAIDIALSVMNFAVYSSDRKIRLFSFVRCKLVCIYDERMQVYDKILSSKSSAFGMDAIEYGKRAALEREMDDAYLLAGAISQDSKTKQYLSTVTLASEGGYHQRFNLTFDDTGTYLLLPTIVGIKAINVLTHRVVATVGRGDASALRFIYLCLCPGDARIDQQMQLARSGGSSAAIVHGGGNDAPNDSLLIALAYGKRRLYAFSHRDPLSDMDSEPDERIILARDVLNEAPDASDLLEASHLGRSTDDPDSISKMTTASRAILRTTHGDIVIKLFKDTPRTIQNFVGHTQSGYYDNVFFHRIIPGFMIQTGDPLGDGTGGESIWGGEFEDEIRRDLRHDRPFTVSMANAGPNTNGSQFFITTVPTPWLDNKHTVFGRVVGGMEVVMAIESVKTDELDRPLSEVKILSIDLS